MCIHHDYSIGYKVLMINEGVDHKAWYKHIGPISVTTYKWFSKDSV